MDDPSQREIAEKQWYSYAFADATEKISVQRSVDILISKNIAGHEYVATTRNRVLANGGKINLRIVNPVGSGRKVLLFFIIDSEGKLDYKSYSGITVTTQTEITPLSLHIPQLRAPTTKVYNAVTFTGGVLRADDLLPLGSGGTARGGSSETIQNIIGEGYELFVELTNMSGQTRDVGFKVQFIEF